MYVMQNLGELEEQWKIYAELENANDAQLI